MEEAATALGLGCTQTYELVMSGLGDGGDERTALSLQLASNGNYPFRLVKVAPLKSQCLTSAQPSREHQ
jgi:hypothetical protein